MKIINPSTVGVSSAPAVTPPQGRLTLTSATPITTSDVTGATTLYYTPFIGRTVPLYDGSRFVPTDIGGEISQLTTDNTKSPAAVANNSMYDIFVWNDAGTLRATRGPAWASDTSRGTGAGTSEIEQINGLWVNKVAITNGPAANRGTLVGSIRSNGAAQLVDTNAARWISNAYNAVPRAMRVVEATNTWDYTTATYRQANGAAANQLDFIQCLSGGMLQANVVASAKNTIASFASVGIGIDSTTAPTDLLHGFQVTPADVFCALSAAYVGYPGLGRHYAAWLERGSAGGTITWYGNASFVQTGIYGTIQN